MSGVKLHLQDPINPAKAGGITPRTQRSLDGGASQHMPSTTNASSRGYPTTRPEAAQPALPSATASTSNSPPPLQPAAISVTQPPMTTAKPSIPPPPKANEKQQPDTSEATAYSLFAKPQPYPPQMSQPPLNHAPNGLPAASTTSTTTVPSFQSATAPTNLLVSAESSTQQCHEHPPGYVQNPYASEMTPDQRLVTEQQEIQARSKMLPSLGYSDNSKQQSKGEFADDHSVIEAALEWGKQKGKQLSDMHDKMWDNIGRK